MDLIRASLDLDYIFAAVKKIFLGYAVEWGTNPNKIFTILFLVIIPFFAVVYTFLLMRSIIAQGKPKSNLLKLIDIVEVKKSGFENQSERTLLVLSTVDTYRNALNNSPPYGPDRNEEIRNIILGLLFGRSLWFSVLSCFHIGWRGFNAGNWLARLQPTAFIYSAEGQIRFLSGIQSILTIILIVIWFSTYFSNPWG